MKKHLASFSLDIEASLTYTFQNVNPDFLSSYIILRQPLNKLGVMSLRGRRRRAWQSPGY